MSRCCVQMLEANFQLYTQILDFKKSSLDSIILAALDSFTICFFINSVLLDKFSEFLSDSSFSLIDESALNNLSFLLLCLTESGEDLGVNRGLLGFVLPFGEVNKGISWTWSCHLRFRLNGGSELYFFRFLEEYINSPTFFS